MNSKSRHPCVELHQARQVEDEALSGAIERILTRELEPMRDELARLRTHVAALRDSFVPW
jgi:hypothetical protein